MEASIQDVFVSLKVNFMLRAEQVDGMKNLIDVHHTLSFLPTGYGKSLIPYTIPLMMDKFR